MTEYRLLRAEEMPTALELWVSVFGVPAEFFTSLLEGGASDDFSVGAFHGEKLVSSVHVFHRSFRDRAGNPLKVGGIGSVSTLPEARRQGHSYHLLELAIQKMEETGCVWTALGTGVNDHYARHGWRTLSVPFLQGRIPGNLSEDAGKPEEVTDELIREMAALHKNGAETPMANARSLEFWNTAVRYRISRPKDRIFAAREEGKLVGYLAARAEDEEFNLLEAVGPADVVHELVRQALGHAANKGVVQAQALVPPIGDVSEAFKAACESVFEGESRHWMGMPIGCRIGWSDLAALTFDPKGRRSELDNF